MNRFQTNVVIDFARVSEEHQLYKLRQQGGLFVDAVRITRMPMVIADATMPGNPIVFANDAFIKLSGYSLPEIVGQDPYFLTGETRENMPILSERALEGERTRTETVEISQYRKDGSEFRAAVLVSPLRDEAGVTTYYFMSFRDVTEQYVAEKSLRALALDLERQVDERTQELQIANQKLSELVAERDLLLIEVNHRAKNSLAIASSLLSIQSREQSDETIKALLEEAQTRLTALSRVHDLLSKSQDFQRIDFAVYLQNLHDSFQVILAGAKRIALVLNAEPGITVDADTAVALSIALTEVVINAVKYAFPTPRHGTIRIDMRRTRDNWVDLVIGDNGIGVACTRKDSMGIQLICAVVEKIRGRLDVSTDDGVKVTIAFQCIAAES